MNQRRTNDEYDNRHERLRHAERTGEYVDFPGGGGIPMMITTGGIAPVPGFVEAAREREKKRLSPISVAYCKRMTARKEIENHGHSTDPKSQA